MLVCIVFAYGKARFKARPLARPHGAVLKKGPRQFMLVCIVFAYEKARFRARPLARPHGAVLMQGPRGDNS